MLADREMAVQLDGHLLGYARSVTVEPSSHKALVPTLFVASAPAGMHELTLVAGPATNTDLNDYFDATVMELVP